MLRLLNAVGSAVYVLYGVMLPALSTAAFNALAIIINVYCLFKLKSDYAKAKKLKLE